MFSVPAARRCSPIPLRDPLGCGHLHTKAFIAASCHSVVLWFVQHRRVVIDPRVSLTEILCHFRTLLPFACSHDSLSLPHNVTLPAVRLHAGCSSHVFVFLLISLVSEDSECFNFSFLCCIQSFC